MGLEIINKIVLELFTVQDVLHLASTYHHSQVVSTHFLISHQSTPAWIKSFIKVPKLGVIIFALMGTFMIHHCSISSLILRDSSLILMCAW
jgi:hypothetical protein